jgi:hypothetical protein
MEFGSKVTLWNPFCCPGFQTNRMVFPVATETPLDGKNEVYSQFLPGGGALSTPIARSGVMAAFHAAALDR